MNIIITGIILFSFNYFKTYILLDFNRCIQIIIYSFYVTEFIYHQNLLSDPDYTNQNSLSPYHSEELECIQA